jgi:internalin A
VISLVRDADLQHLEGLTSLSDVYLSDTQVTDAGLMHLKALTKLDKLTIDSPMVTDA